MDFSNPFLHLENSNSSLVAYICDLVSENGLFKPILAFKKLIQSPLVIVDLSVSGKLSTITRESTIMREIHAKIDIWSAQSIHCNERIHYE